MTSATINLLSANKLYGDNYTTWKNTINSVLIIDDLKFVLHEKCPQVPAPTAYRNVRNAYERWMKANKKAKAYIVPA